MDLNLVCISQIYDKIPHKCKIQIDILIEFKLGQHEIDNAAKHLCKIEELIKRYNESEDQVPLKLPDLKIVITATQYGYKREEDGVYVIPTGCLKD